MKRGLSNEVKTTHVITRTLARRTSQSADTLSDRAVDRSELAPAAAESAARTALDKKGEDLVLLDVRLLAGYADCFVVVSGTSDRHVLGLADAIEQRLFAEGMRPIGIEGRGHAQWVLLDYGDVVVHVFHRDLRGFYDLEGLWADAPRFPVPETPAPERGPTAH